MQPFFSVIVPTYNRASTIEPTLRSVINQTYTDFECLIIDDGSEDVDDLEELVSNLNDPRIKVIRRQNGGGGAARNTGIENAQGRYIAFLDSDDRFLENKLDVFNQAIREQSLQAAYSYAHVDRGIPGKSWIRPDRPIRENESIAAYLFIANQFIQTSTIVIATDIARRIKFDPSLRKGQDLDFCLRADVEGVRFQMIEEPLIVWTDISEIGRTSRHAGAAAPEAWLSKHSHLMTRQEVLGYRATVLSYYQPKYQAFSVARNLFLGVVVAKVPVKVALRHWLRFSLPRQAYRKLVGLIIKISSPKSKKVGANGNVKH